MRSGWETKTLAEVCIVERGSSPRPIDKYFTNSDDGVNWIKIGDTKGVTKYIYSTKQKITKEGAKQSRYVKEGDFILSNSMSFGNPFIMKTSGYIHDGWFVLRLPDYIDTDYFYYLLTSPNVQEQIQFLASGAIVKNISGDLVKRVSLSYPKSLSEQKRIVEILDEAFAAIDKAKANVEKNLQNAKELFESVKNKIFQNLVSNVGTVPLASACNEIFAGGDAPANNFSQIKTEKYKIPIIANAVKDNGLYGYTDLIRVNKPSVTIAARGSGTGHTEIRNEPFFPIVRLIVLVPNIEIITLEFLKYSIQNLEILSSGSAIPQLTVPMIKEYSVPLPLKSEQETIVKKLDTLNAETKKLETIYQQKLNDLEELKKSILQKAFSGELTAKEVV